VARLGRCSWPRVYEVVGEGRELRVEVTDDRVAGAGAVRGSGPRGLEGRVAAVRGGFQVDDLPDGGTQMIAEISCDG